MKRKLLIISAAVAVLLLPLLFTGLHIAKSNDQVQMRQSIARAQAGSGGIGRTLRIYVVGDNSLAEPIKQKLAAALEAKELQFDSIVFVDEIPDDSRESPFLAIRLDSDTGFWTPFWATREVEVALFYNHGMVIDRAKIVAPDPNAVEGRFSDETCFGECSQGERMVTVSSSFAGLISLPHVRTHAAAKVAEEAATLVGDGLPAHWNPEKWLSRAAELAREKLGPSGSAGGSFMSYQRWNGCPGVIVLAGRAGSSGPEGTWHLMYYDADQDAIAGHISHEDVRAQLPEVRLAQFPSFGVSENGLLVFLDHSYRLKFPEVGCGLEGWEVARQ